MSLPLSVNPSMPGCLPLSVGFDRYGLEFDGVGQYGMVSDDTSLNPGSITVLGFFKFFSIPDGWTVMVAKNPDTGSGYTLRLYKPAAGISRIRFDFNNGAWQTTVTPYDFELDRFYCIAASYDGGSGDWAHYVNGLQVNSGTTAAGDIVASTGTDLYLMVDTGLNTFTYGVCSLLLVYNRALSEREVLYDTINYHSPIRNGLVLWLPIEEGSGLTTYDRSGYGNNNSLLPAADPPTWKKVKMWELRAEVEL